MTFLSMRLVTVFCLSALLLACSGEKQQQAPQMPPPEVDVAKPLKKTLTLWDEFSGRFEPVKSVQLRSRVSGFLIKSGFKDGEIVNEGDILFQIDPRPFQLEVDRAQAQYNLALNEFNRAEGLLKTRAISKEDYERRLQEKIVAQSDLENAKLNLSFTEITAPFAGRMSDNYIDVGNLVLANQDVLSSLVSLDPIHFEFDASQGEFLRYIRLGLAGERSRARDVFTPTFVKLQDEDSYQHAGFIDFVDNAFGEATGTIRGRALITNPDLIITPGQFGRGRIPGVRDREFIVLPERSINTDQDRKFVYTVNKENQAIRSYVEVGRLLDNGFVIIRGGLDGDEDVVLAGRQRIRGAEQVVTPKQIELTWTEVDVMPDLDSVQMPEFEAQKEAKGAEKGQGQ